MAPLHGRRACSVVPMHVVIMGCGRVGTELAHSLQESGHSIAVIDQDAKALQRLGESFHGQRVIGVGIDRDTLLEAGIERAGAFADVSNGDNSNIIAARVARENFGIEHVVARIYDPGRAEVYARLGIPTVATVRWTSDQILRRLLPDHASDDWHDPSGRVIVAEVSASPAWIGTTFDQVERQSGGRIVAVSRYGEGFIPSASSVYQEADIIHAAGLASEMDRIRAILAGSPEESA